MNDYEKASLDRFTTLKISPALNLQPSREAFEKERGGQAETLLAGLSQETMESPKKLAPALSETYGAGAELYFTQIVRYEDSGNFYPEEDEETVQEEAELESVIQATGADSDQTIGTDAYDES